MSGLGWRGGEYFFHMYSFFFFTVIEIQDLGFDHDFCFAFLYPVALFSPKNHWTIFLVILVFSAAAGKETVVQVSQKVAGRCMTARRG